MIFELDSIELDQEGGKEGRGFESDKRGRHEDNLHMSFSFNITWREGFGWKPHGLVSSVDNLRAKYKQI